MSLLERLTGVTPKRGARPESERLNKLILRHMSEIEAARVAEHTWGEISRALKAELEERGEWNQRWKPYTIEPRYHQIKRGAVI